MTHAWRCAFLCSRPVISKLLVQAVYSISLPNPKVWARRKETHLRFVRMENILMSQPSAAY